MLFYLLDDKILVIIENGFVDLTLFRVGPKAIKIFSHSEKRRNIDRRHVPGKDVGAF